MKNQKDIQLKKPYTDKRDVRRVVRGKASAVYKACKIEKKVDCRMRGMNNGARGAKHSMRGAKQAVRGAKQEVHGVNRAVRGVEDGGFVRCAFVEPKHIEYKSVKTIKPSSRTVRHNAFGAREKFIIYCPQERVKQYAQIVKNSDMAPVAIKPCREPCTEARRLKAKDYIILLVVGLIIGFVNGFFGGGGGMLCVPLLLFFLKLKDKMAHATAILIMLPISVVSIIVYISNFTVEFDTALYVVLGSVVGGVLGSLLLKKLSNVWIRAIFALVMVGAGIKMIW